MAEGLGYPITDLESQSSALLQVCPQFIQLRAAQTKRWKVAGYNMSHSITSCSDDHRQCFASTSLIQQGVRSEGTVTMAKIPKTVRRGKLRTLLLISHISARWVQVPIYGLVVLLIRSTPSTQHIISPAPCTHPHGWGRQMPLHLHLFQRAKS